MSLSKDDIREILDIIDAAGDGEIRVQTEGFSLHVVKGEGVLGSAAARPAAAPEPQAAAVGVASSDEGLTMIDSPMLGTFYRAEAPSAAAFVEVGTVVEPDTVVCIIEVMKMMTSVTAGLSGTVASILPENGQLVEFGEPLFGVEPA